MLGGAGSLGAGVCSGLRGPASERLVRQGDHLPPRAWVWVCVGGGGGGDGCRDSAWLQGPGLGPTCPP